MNNEYNKYLVSAHTAPGTVENKFYVILHNIF
jgi:hypothetical protein